MLRPINKKKTKTAASISSNQVLWDGPDIPCIDLCKGDTITDVTYKLATEVCKIMEQLDPANYNLDCINLDHCENITFQQLLQALINQVYCENGDGGGGNNGGETPEDCCQDLPFIPTTVYYAQHELGDDLEMGLEEISFTIFDQMEEGVYEVDFTVDVESTGADRVVEFSLNINETPYQPQLLNRVVGREGDTTDTLFLNTRLFASNIQIQQGDKISIFVDYPLGVPNVRFTKAHRGVIKITKIG
jgi:hypothetical protein